MAVKRVASTIDVRDLDEQTRMVIQRVKEDGEIIDVADGDSVVARLVPAETSVDREAIEEWLARHNELVEEIGRYLPKDVSVADAIADIRREL